MKKIIIKFHKYRSWQGIKIKIYRRFHDNGFEAIAFMLGKRILWIADKEAYDKWPKTSG